MYVWFWLCAAVVFVILEAATVGLTSIWFAVGALAALLAALCGAELWLQTVLFVVLSVMTLLLTRPLAKKYVNSRHRPTNADRVLDMEGIVTEKIENLQGAGAVSIDGKIWTARSADGQILEPGTVVRPIRIEGVKLIVRPAEEKAVGAAENK